MTPTLRPFDDAELFVDPDEEADAAAFEQAIRDEAVAPAGALGVTA